MATVPVYIYGETVNDVLNIARSRVADLKMTPSGFPSGSDPGQQFTAVGGGENISTGTNPDGTLILRTQVIVNAAWRKFQKYLANLGYRLLIGDNLIISGLPPNLNGDPAVQAWLSWNGFFDGVNFNAGIALPSNFYAPLKLSERVSLQQSVFIPMRCALDGVRTSFLRTVLNRQWEWRTNALYLPGATNKTDIQFRYIRFLPNFPDPNYFTPNTPWYNQQIPIVGAGSAFAWYIAYEAMASDADGDAALVLLQAAQSEADEVFNDQARADQRTNNRRRPRDSGNSERHGYRFGL